MNAQTNVFLLSLISLVAVLFVSCRGDEEVLAPEITSISPMAGVAGITEVNISGKNFSAVLENNTVSFGLALSSVTAATSTSLTVIVPSDAVTGKISITTNGITVTSEEDFIVEVGPTDFFTLIVDESFVTTSGDHWIMASSRDGEWIDVQSFESGDIKKLNGIVPDGSTFTLHLFSMPSGSNNCSIRSFGEVPVNSGWHLKSTPPSNNNSVGALALQVNNYPFSPGRPSPPNLRVNVSSNVGVLNYIETISGDAVNMNIRLRANPADMLVTVYKDGFPHYSEYKNVTVPSTMTVDALTDVKIADRNFTMKFPAGNNDARATIEAFRGDDKYGYIMSELIDLNGASSLNMGYNLGYQRYRTRVSCSFGIAGFDGRRDSNYGRVASTVEENPVLPPFSFSISKIAADDFAALTDLSHDVSGIIFTYSSPDLELFWSVLQPNVAGSLSINFKLRGFALPLLEKYPFLPPLNEVTYNSVWGFQDMGSDSYNRMLDRQAEDGSFNPNVSSDNYYQFIKHAH